MLQALAQSAQHIYEKKEGSGSGSVPLTNGSGSGRPQNMRIRIPNTSKNSLNEDFLELFGVFGILR